MDTIMNFLEAKLMPVATKMGANRYLTAIRDGFIAIMPLTILGSFFYLIDVVIIGPDGLTMKLFNNPMTDLLQLGQAIIPATMSMMALLTTFTIAKSLASFYEEDTTIAPTVAVVCLFVLMPIKFSNGLKLEYVNTYYTGSAALFTGFICAFGAVELIRILGKAEWLKIKMPEGVPPMVGRSFSNLLPVMLTVIAFGLIRVLTNLSGKPLNDLIFSLIQIPFANIVTSPVGIGVIYFFYMLFWGFGIHTAFIFGPLLTPVYLQNITENAKLIAAHQPAVHIMTQSFIDITTQMGGAGNMLALIIAIFIASKRADYREVSKIALVPAIFNISEPMMFGLPVVMNPILIIPMILSTLAGIGIGALATSVGFMGYTYVITTSVIPAGILGFLGTGGSVGAVITTFIILAVSVVIYMPFVMVMNKQVEKEVA